MNQIKFQHYVKALVSLVFILLLHFIAGAQPHLHYLMAGEATSTTIILQTRLAIREDIIYNNVHDKTSLMETDLPGITGWVRFVWQPAKTHAKKSFSAWQQALETNDFIVRWLATGLQPGQRIEYAVQYGADTLNSKQSAWQQCKIPYGEKPARKTSLVMVTGSHLSRFYLGGGFGKPSAQGADAYAGTDKLQGFHGFESIARLRTDFFIGNGDNVYYDHPDDVKATTEPQMRAMWHRQFAMPRIRQMFVNTTTYWMKDDHDHRFDDSDTLPKSAIHGSLPTHDEGRRLFIEQVPLHMAYHADSPTYRTIRINKWLQVWMLEARDHRSPNSMPDGPEKTMWGKAQKAWLHETLLQSDATYKLIVNPTPMLGPDDARKRDNHANPEGFFHEGESFFTWLKARKFDPARLFILTGDRHWQYRSIHPNGFEELSCGAMVDQNARMGVLPGSANSSDPQGRIVQPYTSQRPSGGFLQVLCKQNSRQSAQLTFIFRDEYGKALYTYKPK